jgi:hypothetical protein
LEKYAGTSPAPASNPIFFSISDILSDKRLEVTRYETYNF